MIWLVAEDEADIRNLITLMVQILGHNTMAFENGKQVWDWLETIENGNNMETVPDLVLMDIRMPGKKGNEVARRMREIDTFAKTPIVLMTAFSLSDGDEKEFYERDGVDKILQKPLPDFLELQQIFEKIILEKNKT